MSVAEQLNTILDQHHRNPGAAADALLDLAQRMGSAEEAAMFASVVCQVVGAEIGDWTLARNLVASLRDGHQQSVGVQGNLAVAAYLAGRWVDGLAAETRAATAAQESALAVCAWIRLATAHALQRKPDWEAWFKVIMPALALASGLEMPSRHDTAIAQVANNIAGDLLDLEKRSNLQAAALEQAALVARKLWQRAGSWMHQARADYQLALVYNALGRFPEAHKAATAALATIATQGDEPVDRAFLNIELALASRELGRRREFEQASDTARNLAETFDEPGLREWFDTKFGRIRFRAN